MSHVNNTHYTLDHVADARALAKGKLASDFSPWAKEGIPANLPKNTTQICFDNAVIYFHILTALDESSNPLAPLTKILANEQDAETRLKLIANYTEQLDSILDSYSSPIFRLAIYPQIAALLVEEDEVREHLKLKSRKDCGDGRELSVLDLLVTVECKKEEESEAVIIVESAVSQGEAIAREGKKRWVAKLTKLYNLQSEQEKQTFLNAVCKAAGEKEGVILQHLGLIAPKEKKKQPLSNRKKAAIEEDRDEQSVKSLKTACDRMEHIVTTTPKGWIGRACNLWKACLREYSVKELQTLATLFNKIENKDKRINLVRALLKLTSQKMSQLAINLRKTHLPSQKVAKHAGKIGEKKRKQKIVKDDPFAKFEMANVKEVSLKQGLSSKEIPTEGFIRIIDVPKNPADQLCKLLQLCELDKKRRVIVLRAIQPHINRKMLKLALTTTIGRVLILVDDKTFKEHHQLANMIATSLKDDAGLRATLRWRLKPNLDGLVKAASSLKGTPHAPLCAALFYNYVQEQLKRVKNGQVEKLATAVDELFGNGMSSPQAALDRAALTIEVWSTTGTAKWVEKAVVLWDRENPQVKERTIATVLRGIVASDDPEHRANYLLTVLQSPEFFSQKDRDKLACELITTLLKKPRPEDIQIAVAILEGLAERMETIGEVYEKAATQIFKAICSIKNLTVRLGTAHGFMIAVQMRMEERSPKEWHHTHFSWLSDKTDIVVFSETLRYIPRLKSLVKPMQALYKKLTNSPVEYRLLLAARLIIMGEEQPAEFGKEHDLVLADCCFMELLSGTHAHEPLNCEWKGCVKDYQGPAPELKYRLETTISARLIMRKLERDNPSNLKETTAEMIELLDRTGETGEVNGAVLLAFNELCLALIDNKPTKEDIAQIGLLFQKANETKIYRDKPDGMVHTSIQLMGHLHNTHPAMVPHVWRMILQNSGLNRDFCLMVANNWMSQLEAKDTEEFAKVFIVTSQLAAKTEGPLQAGNLTTIAAQLWRKAVRNETLLTPNQACAWFLSGAKLIIEKKGTLPNSFYHTAYLLMTKYDEIEDSPVPTFVQKLSALIGVRTIKESLLRLPILDEKDTKKLLNKLFENAGEKSGN